MSNVLLLLVEDGVLLHIELEEALKGGRLRGLDRAQRLWCNRTSRFERGAVSGILTDIRLGKGPEGWDVGHRARELAAHMPIVYMSGDSAAGWASKGVPNSVMLDKPFAMAQAVTAISQLLNENRPG